MTQNNRAEVSEVHRTLATPNPDFDAWVASMDKILWAKFDLSAARLGWEAALRARPAAPEGEWVVKPLEWRSFEVSHEYGNGVWDANGPWTTYTIQDCLERWGDGDDRFYVPSVSQSFATLDEAKAAAQADYEQRIISALAAAPKPEPTSAAGMTDTLRKLAKDYQNASDASTYSADSVAFHERSIGVQAALKAIEAALSQSQEPAPGHTDLMVTPESIDAFLEANPPPEPQPDAAAFSPAVPGGVKMDSGNITRLRTVTTVPHNPDDILEAAKGKLSRVIIVGETIEGGAWRSASHSDASLVLMDIKRFEHWLLGEV